LNEREPSPEAAPMVYIVSQQPFDYTPAADYGTLYFMRPLKLAPTVEGDGGRYNLSRISTVRKELQDYRPGVDFIVPTGSPAGLLVVGMILGHIGQTHKMLQWDAQNQKYNMSEVQV
jgi:hypothetical protein